MPEMRLFGQPHAFERVGLRRHVLYVIENNGSVHQIVNIRPLPRYRPCRHGGALQESCRQH